MAQFDARRRGSDIHCLFTTDSPKIQEDNPDKRCLFYLGFERLMLVQQ